MNFSREEEEELRKLRQRVAQQDGTISTLHAEENKRTKEMSAINDECNALKRKVIEGEDKLTLLEDSLDTITKERDQLKTANHNVQQTLTQTQLRLQGREKDVRLQTADQDRTSQSLLQHLEKELEEERRKRVKLEEQVQSSVIPTLQHGADRGRHSAGLEAKIAALEKENTALKAEVSRSKSFASGSLSPASTILAKRARRPRSSSVSNGSDVDAQQLRDLLSEANTKVDQLEAKVTKAEREKNKACNEQIAAGKASATTIAALQESVSELRDEIQFQRENIIKGLEAENEEMKMICSRLPALEHELKQSQSEITTLQLAVKTSKEEGEQLRADILVKMAQISSAVEENAALREHLTAAEDVARKLNQKEKEVESAKRRTTKLSVSIRKMLRSLGDAPANIGDETASMAPGNDTSVFNMTSMTSQEYEADLVDELEQLLQSIDEADRCLDFAQVEWSVQAKSEQAEYSQIAEKLRASEEAMATLEATLTRRDAEYEEAKTAIQVLQDEKRQIELNLREVEATSTELVVSRDTLSEQLTHSRDENERLRSELEAGKLACGRVEEALNKLQTESAQTSLDLQNQLSELKDSEAALQGQLEASTEDVTNLNQLVEDQTAQYAAQSVSLELIQKEKEAIEALLNHTKDNLEKVGRSEWDLQYQEAQLTLDLHNLQEELRDHLRVAAAREVELLTMGIKEVQAERTAWESLVQEEGTKRQELMTHLAHLESSSRAERAESIKLMEVVIEERDKARKELVITQEEVQKLQLDLQESRMNKQLAEDALSRLYPNARDNDVTVMGDFSCFDVTQVYSAESPHAGAVTKEWENRLKSKNEEVEVAKSDALHWRKESEKHLNALQEQQEVLRETSERVSILETQVIESRQAQSIAQTSLETMQMEMDARMMSLQKIQLSLQTSEEVLLDLQARQNQVKQEKDDLVAELTMARNTSADQVEILNKEIQSKDQEISTLRNEIEGLMQTATDLSEQLKEADAIKSTLQARCEELEKTCTAHEVTQKERNERVSLLEKAIADSEENTSNRSEKMLHLSEELKDAKEGYEKLKRQLESRNVEYWETKEELAEWQERYERSQADVKIKSELEERLKEAEDELEMMRGRIEQGKEQCAALEEHLAGMRKEKEESYSRFNSLMEELHESRKLASLLEESRQQLSDTTALVEQLEHDLAQKAQECEDADDKELALRKDNKRLAARLATLQARIDKLQQAAIPISQSAIPNKAAVESTNQETTPQRTPAEGATPSSSRKRRAPEDEDLHSRETDAITAPSLTRAIYAPKTTSTAARPIKMNQNSSAMPPPKLAIQSAPIRKVSHSPSDLIAKRMKSPKKDSLQDRTNLQQPRQQSEKATLPNGDSQHFMAKLNRYRAPTIPL